MKMSGILKQMELSALAYQEVQPAFPAGSLVVIDDPQSDIQCYLRRRDGCLNITFRGSNSEKDWKTNLAYQKKTIPYENTASKIRVHKGFINAYKSPLVRDVIHRQITNNIYQVKITGHSQGAALAILCAVDLQFNFPDRDYEAVVFGSPRVGNRAFQKSYNKRVFKTMRVENGNDIVTKLPFIFMGYRHVGMKLHVGMPRLPGVFCAEDHYPQAYYINLFRKNLP